MQHFVDRGRTPSGRTLLLRPWRWSSFGIQLLGDPRVARPGRTHAEDAPDDRRLLAVDAPLDMAVYLHVVVAEYPTAGDVARLRFAHHRLAGPLPDLPPELRVHLRAHEPDDVVAEAAEREPRAVLVEPDLDAGAREALQLAERLVPVAPAEARVVAHDEYLKRGPGRDRVEQPLAVDEFPRLGTADRIVGVDMRVRYSPPFRGGKRAGIRDLPFDGLRVRVGPVLFGGLARVDRRDGLCSVRGEDGWT